MGVEYYANYGIGYKVVEKEEELEDGLAGYLYGKVGDAFEHFEVGEGSYTGETNDFYIVIKNAFKDGLDLTEKKAQLDEELKRLKLLPDSEFGDVGGLFVC